MPSHNPSRGDTEHASHTLLLTNSSGTLRAWCPVTAVACSRTGAWQPVGLFQAQALLGSWLDAILEQLFSSAVLSLQREDLCLCCFGIVGVGNGTSERWLMSGRELSSLQQRRCEEDNPVTLWHLGHPLLETKELKIAQSFPSCPLVINGYGL